MVLLHCGTPIYLKYNEIIQIFRHPQGQRNNLDGIKLSESLLG